jgi:GNAT superfamily N-acetyltransferase
MSKFNYTYDLITKDHLYFNQVKDTIKLALQESPFGDLEIDDEMLSKTLASFDYYDSKGSRYFMAAFHEDEVVGLVSAMTLENHFMMKDTGQEIVWWVKKEHRGTKLALTLFNTMEEWAASQGLKRLLSGHYHNDQMEKLKKLYISQGYTPVEYNYKKELTHD